MEILQVILENPDISSKEIWLKIKSVNNASVSSLYKKRMVMRYNKGGTWCYNISEEGKKYLAQPLLSI